MFRRHHAIALLLCLPIVTALSAGCDNTEKATPQVIFESQLLATSSTDCRDSGSFFNVGSFGNPAADTPVKSDPIKDGEPFDQGTASVSCSVTPAGNNEFDVTASVALSGATGGLFRIDGHFTATGDQQNIHAFFSSRKSGNSYEEKDSKCTVRYTTSYQGIAAGRVWGDLDCPLAVNDNAETSCNATATFRFENCAQ